MLNIHVKDVNNVENDSLKNLNMILIIDHKTLC